MYTDKISLLYPSNQEIEFNTLPAESFHDLGLDLIIKCLSQKESEQNFISGIMSKITDNPDVAKYRIDVFNDIYKNKKFRESLLSILDQINFLKNYGSLEKQFFDGPSVWDLMHRLEEIHNYISAVEAIYNCLDSADISSDALLNLKAYVDKMYHDKAFGELKADIENCKGSTKELRSITLGINLSEQFEATEIGVVSINNKYFTKSNLISSFHDRLILKDQISESNEWNENYKFSPFSASSDVIGRLEKLTKKSTMVAHPLLAGSLGAVPDGDTSENVTFYMNSITNHMLSITTKKLRNILNKYVSITISDITNLIPEFIYYIRWAEYLEALVEKGYTFAKAEVNTSTPRMTKATNVYNMKLAAFSSEEHQNIITNDLIFDDENRVYILTGANRGGKTTITQCIGQLFVLAQGGIYIPGEGFEFSPVDNIFTHFPADEDKTMDLGRLGEECKRFKEMYTASTKDSLLLLNETFSTTSFEEGYYIAKDSVKAILAKGVRTIYNTHMHKLAFDIDEINEGNTDGKAQSLIVKAENGARSYKIEVAKPVGQSFAKDIAEKYGVTFEMLTGK